MFLTKYSFSNKYMKLS